MKAAEQKYKKGDKQAIAYEYIRSAIMKNRLEPNTQLTEKDLSEELEDMSRTPIHDALTRLEHEGLVERIPGKGLFVTRASITDLMEITEIRLPLECTAVRLFIERADESMRENLAVILETHKRNFKTGDNLAAVASDNAFHFTIAKGSMNNRLYNTIYKLIEENARGAFMTHRDTERIDHSIHEHEQVLAAIRANDVELAVSLVRDHLNNWLAYIKEMQFKNYFWF